MFTILGSTGFIGNKLALALKRGGHEVYAPRRDDPQVFVRELGDVIYSIGVTADFRSRPFETVEAHVCLLRQLLQSGNFRSLLYLSSTRVYGRTASAEEGQVLGVDPAEPEDLYNLSKLMGESLCLSTGLPSVRVVRLSNVYGDDFRSQNFLSEILRHALGEGRVHLHTALSSAKDYVGIADVIELLPKVATGGNARLYNVASGRNVTHKELVDRLSRVVPLIIKVEERAPTVVFPQISINRVRKEFGFAPRDVLADLPQLVADFMKALSAK